MKRSEGKQARVQNLTLDVVLYFLYLKMSRVYSLYSQSQCSKKVKNKKKTGKKSQAQVCPWDALDNCLGPDIIQGIIQSLNERRT